MLGQRQGIHRRLLGAQLGNDILQVHGRAGAGLARQDQELVDVAGVQGRPALVDQAVLVPVVNGAQAGAVTQLGAQLGELGVKVGNIDLAQACLAKLGDTERENSSCSFICCISNERTIANCQGVSSEKPCNSIQENEPFSGE